MDKFCVGNKLKAGYYLLFYNFVRQNWDVNLNSFTSLISAIIKQKLRFVHHKVRILININPFTLLAILRNSFRMNGQISVLCTDLENRVAAPNRG